MNHLNSLKEKCKIIVFGMQNWANYDNLDIDYLNNLSLHLPTNFYLDYNNSRPQNILPENKLSSATTIQVVPDPCFNSVIPTTIDDVDLGVSSAAFNGLDTSKSWKRIFCPIRGAFITIEYTFNNLQMVSASQGTDVEIGAQILWMRKAGRQLPIGR